MITATRKLPLVEMDILTKLCTPAMETWMLLFQEIEMVTAADQKISEYSNSGRGRKNTFHVCQRG